MLIKYLHKVREYSLKCSLLCKFLSVQFKNFKHAIVANTKIIKNAIIFHNLPAKIIYSMTIF